MTPDIHSVMKALAAQRKIFHSEADFQHAFAWELHLRQPNASIRLEKPLRKAGKSVHLDFLIENEGKSFAVELKYKTRSLKLSLDGEDFHLSSHSAQDLGRYDFIKDICRLEKVTTTISNCEGCAIILTNDSAYWKTPQNAETVDAAFRLTGGRILSGDLVWTDQASAGTKKNRESELSVAGKYKLAWEDYSTVASPSYSDFRYLAVKVRATREASELHAA